MKNSILVKSFLLTAVFMLPQLACAYDFMVNGLCYNKNSGGTSVTVTYQRTTSPRYTNLTGNIIIPETVTYNGATYSVTSIDDFAFSGCSGLTSVVIPNSVTSIGKDAFYECSGLTSVDIPNSVTSIGKYAFHECSGLTSVVIPNSVTSIGEDAFTNCYALREVYAHWTTPPTITQYVFANAAMNTVTYYYDSSIGSAIHIPVGTTSNYKAKVGWKNFYAIEDVNVVELPTSLELDKGIATLQVGETLQLMMLTDNAGAISWTSENEDVATVDSNGLVTAVGAGLVCVHATNGNGATTFCAIVSYLPGDLNNDGVVDENDQLGSNVYNINLGSGNVALGIVNETSSMPVGVQNTEAVTSFAVTVSLPGRIELVDDMDTFIEATERGAGFDFSAVQNDDGTITITGTSSTPLEAGEGPVLNLKVKTAWQNTYTIPVTNITVTTANGDIKQLPDSETRLVMQGVRGDMNGDGRVDLSDALYIINLATGQAE